MSEKRPRINNPTNVININNSKKFRAAGLFFTNDKVFLAGFQRKKRRNGTKIEFISGLGGAAEGVETDEQAAVRETVEELYEFCRITGNRLNCDSIEKIKLDDKMLQEIEENINLSIKIETIGKEYLYSFFKCSFDDLRILIRIVNKYMSRRNKNIISLTYPEKLPENIEELLLLREDYCGKHPDIKQEVISLAMMPLTKVTKDLIRYDIIGNLNKIMNNISININD